MAHREPAFPPFCEDPVTCPHDTREIKYLSHNDGPSQIFQSFWTSSMYAFTLWSCERPYWLTYLMTKAIALRRIHGSLNCLCPAQQWIAKRQSDHDIEIALFHVQSPQYAVHNSIWEWWLSHRRRLITPTRMWSPSRVICYQQSMWSFSSSLYWMSAITYESDSKLHESCKKLCSQQPQFFYKAHIANYYAHRACIWTPSMFARPHIQRNFQYSSIQSWDKNGPRDILF